LLAHERRIEQKTVNEVLNSESLELESVGMGERVWEAIKCWASLWQYAIRPSAGQRHWHRADHEEEKKETNEL